MTTEQQIEEAKRDFLFYRNEGKGAITKVMIKSATRRLAELMGEKEAEQWIESVTKQKAAANTAA